MSHWPRLPVSAVCEIVKGGVDPQRYPAELFAHYSIPALDEGYGPAIEVGDAIKSQKTVIENQVVLVSKLNPRIPRVWLVDDDQACRRICSTEFVPLKPDPARLDLAYLAFAMRFALADGQISGSTSAATKSRERAKPNDLLRLTLPLPPLDEQRRIVDLLARAEGIVRLRREAEQKAAELIPALFLDMFGDPATNPKGWQVGRIGDLGRVQLGRQRAPKYQTGAYTRSYVRVANVFEDRIDISDVLSMDFDDKDFPQYKLQYGDILLNEGQSTELVGRPAMWRDEISNCCFQNTLVRFQPDPALMVPQFALAALLNYYRSGVLSQISSKTSNVAHLGAARFANLNLYCPPLHQQRFFALRFEEMRSINNQQLSASAKAQETFDALLASVFSETAH